MLYKLKKPAIALLPVLALWTFVACEVVDIKGTGTDEDNVTEDLWYSAVAFEEGYDWRNEAWIGSPPCRMLVFKNGVLNFSLELDSEDYMSSEPDMHFLKGGKLYTVHYRDGETIIKRNGENCISFPGEEYISDLFVEGERVHCICWITGDTWRYRIDGKSVMEKKNSPLLSPLYKDCGAVCFAFSENLASTGESGTKRHYFVENGHPTILTLLPSVTNLYAARRHNGVMNTLTREEGIDGIVWMQGDETLLIKKSGAMSYRDCSFTEAGGKLYAHSQVRTVLDLFKSRWGDYFWDRDGTDVHTTDGNMVCASCEGGPRLCFASSSNAGSSPITVHMGEAAKMQDQYFMLSPYALCCTSSRYFIGMNDAQDNNRPVVISGADVMKMNFNGYFTRFSLP